jgi:hypothetical protein
MRDTRQKGEKIEMKVTDKRILPEEERNDEIYNRGYVEGYIDGKDDTIDRVMKILDDGRAVTKAELEAIRKEML